MNEAIKILSDKLEEYNRAFKKSKESYHDGFISLELHEKHVSNLSPKISVLAISIDVLKKYFD